MDCTEYTKNIPADFLDFVRIVRQESPVQLESIHVVGSVLTPDYQADRSDINSLFVVREAGVSFLDFLVGLGKRFRRRQVAPPLIMTKQYISRSLDVFPVEFYTLREIHYTLHGNDLLKNLEIDAGFLRLQCERELKAKLLWLGQIYLQTLADKEDLSRKLCAAITGCIPVFRAILHLAGGKVSLSAQQTVVALELLLEIDTGIFQTLLQMKKTKKMFVGMEELRSGYIQLHTALARLSRYVDSMAD